jgi:hypothetical protein
MKAHFFPAIAAILLLSIATITYGGVQDAGFTFEAPRHIAIDSLSYGFSMYAYLTNTGDSTDIFQITMTREVPDSSWTTMLCLHGFCLPPWVVTAPDTLAVGESDSLIDVTFQSKTFGLPFVEGAAYASLTVSSMRNPSLTETINFTFISDGTEVLVVDDDGMENYQDYYESAIPAERAQGTWARTEQAPTADDLSNFEFIVWETGEATPTLTGEDRDALSTYLGAGGRLFISGQDIGFALADPASNEYSAATLDFYNNFLHANYVADDAGLLALTGVSGDPISDGIDIEIAGGDGADNQTSPSIISPRRGATNIFYYGLDSAGAVKAETDGHKVVYLAFGFEAIDNQNDRSEIMSRAIDWLELPVGIDDDLLQGADLPGQAVLGQNYPNPFNPLTQIAVDVPGETGRKVQLSLTVYSLRGRKVRTLFDGELSAGRHSFTWDGRDLSGRQVPSGTYLYSLRAGDRVDTRKMILVK